MGLSQRGKNMKSNIRSENGKKKVFSIGLTTGIATAVSFAVISACTGQQAGAKPNVVHKDSGKPGVLAKIGDEEITEETLIGNDKSDFFELKKREYDLKMDRINRLMVEKLVGAEAKKANLSLDDYLFLRRSLAVRSRLPIKSIRSSSKKNTFLKLKSILR